MEFTTSQIAHVTSGELKGEEKVIQAATQDSRKVTPGCLFIPLISERDGHAYIEEALSLGASAYLTEQEPKEGTSIRVENTGTALTQLGKSARFSFHVPVVGITGSVGKTSVKDMTNAVLSQQGNVHASLNSYNNEIGVPLTLLNTPDDSSFLVLEMGARKEGDIAELSEITSETEKEEKELIKKSQLAQKKIDNRLLSSYNRIRGSVRNGLALVSVDRDACGGCFNKIPPQRQLDIKLHKKVIVCEHCGRILVDSNILSEKL